MWCKALESRFREVFGVSFSRLESLRYTVRDARNRHDPENFVQKMIVNERNSGLVMTDVQQVLLIYEHFDAEFRRDLSVYNKHFIMSKFLKYVIVQKSIWFKLFAPKSYKDSSRSNKFETNRRGRYNNFKRASFQSLSPSQYQNYPPGNRALYRNNFRGGPVQFS